MIATFIDLTGQTFVREIKKLEKILNYIPADDPERMLRALMDKTPIKNPSKTQTYVLESVRNSIPLYREVIQPYTDAAQLREKEVVKVPEVKAVEPVKTVEPIDSGFDAMYKKLKGNL